MTHATTKKTLLTMMLIALAGAGLTGCGGDDEVGGRNAQGDDDLEAQPEPAPEPTPALEPEPDPEPEEPSEPEPAPIVEDEPEAEPEAEPEPQPEPEPVVEPEPEGQPEPQPEPELTCPEGEILCDDGCFDPQSDAEHCGGCAPCAPVDGAASICVEGVCRFECEVGFRDLDRAAINGCECQITNGGQDTCDGIDNNCDGGVDNGFHGCEAVEGALTYCFRGACEFSCTAGFVNLDQDAANGCECQITNGRQDVCDGIDNDCDGIVDNPETACDSPYGGFSTCVQGACDLRCAPSFVDVDGQAANGCECHITNGGREVCDGRDNDCDGQIDEGGDVCERLPGADVSCVDGACEFDCVGSFVDIDGEDFNGCECQITNGGRDLCDGVDNDCDGIVDNAIEPCAALAGATVSCVAGACQFNCIRGFVNVDRLAVNGCECGISNSGQEICDGADNDCDGFLDNNDSDYLPTLCSEQEGVCEGSEAECEAGVVLECPLETYEALASIEGVRFDGLRDDAELTCDGLDNNCDGAEDENCCGGGEGVVEVALDLPFTQRQVRPTTATSADGSLTFFAWQHTQDATGVTPETGEVRWVVVDRSLRAVGSIGRLFATGAETIDPAAAWDGSGFVMVAVHRSQEERIAIVRVSPQGAAQESRILVTDARRGFNFADPAIAMRANGTGVVTWTQSAGDVVIPCINETATSCVKATRVNAQLGASTIDEVSVQPELRFEASRSAVALNQAGGMVTWFKKKGDVGTLQWKSLTVEGFPVGDVLEQRLFSRIATNVRPSMVASDRSFHIASLTEGSNTQLAVRVMGLNANGSRFGNRVFAETNSPRESVVIGAMGQGFAVAWLDKGFRNFVRVQPVLSDGLPVGQPVDVIEEASNGRIFTDRLLNFSELEGVGAVLTYADPRSASLFGKLNAVVLNADLDKLCFER